MLKKSSWVIVFFILGSLMLLACQQGQQPSVATEPKSPGTSLTGTAQKAAWEEKWANVLAEAKKEGAVVLYNLWRQETRVALTQAFKDKYGINVEFSPFSRGSDLLAKVQAEKRAGLYLADVFGAGSGTLIATMKPEGLLGPLEPLLILPEVLDQKAWRGGKIPFADRDGLAVYLIGTVIRTVIYNTNLIKEGEITSYRDLLKPQYKGKITLNDPSVTGPGFSAVVHLGENLWGEAETLEFLRRLIKEQEAVVYRDNRIHIESVVRGKYPIGLGPLPDLIAEFLELGAPMKVAMVKEDNRMTQAAGAISVPTRSAHPNAATVFVNWLLTKEGQSIYAKSFGNPGMRIDASLEGIDPLFIPKPGEKYYMETEEYLLARARWLEILKRFMDEMAK